MLRTPSPGYSIVVRLEINNIPGMFGKVASSIGNAGGSIGAIDLIEVGKGFMVRDVVVNVADVVMGKEVVRELKSIKGVRILNVADRTYKAHEGGKIEVMSKIPLKNHDDLSMAYTPGVARVCMTIHEDPKRAYDLTIKKNTVAVVTDGTAVLGLGDIGPEAAMPVMEGKALLFKEFGGVDAFPICLDTKNPEEIISAVKWMAPGFGGINLEDISSPRCFEIEDRLKRELDIPVFHDDQHGTAVVVLAGLINALKIVGKSFEKTRIVVSGIGAAGVASIRLLLSFGVEQIIGCDRSGILYSGRKENMNQVKEALSGVTNPERLKGSVSNALEGADVFIGLSEPGAIRPADIEKMANDPILFLMANPIPEIMPEDVPRKVRVLATGRSDYPNQVNNVLCFPGLFRGVLDRNATGINREMLVAAAHAIASVIEENELREDNIIPSVFNRKVPQRVADAVRNAAVQTGVARLEHHYLSFYSHDDT